MKRFAVVLSLLAFFSVVTSAWAVDEALISKNVDEVVVAIENGDDIMAMKADAYEPYMFIMEENGKMLVHPSLAGESLKEKAPPVYTALMAATPEGVWVEYEWKGKTKHTYAKRTKDNLIVGSGY